MTTRRLRGAFIYLLYITYWRGLTALSVLCDVGNAKASVPRRAEETDTCAFFVSLRNLIYHSFFTAEFEVSARRKTFTNMKRLFLLLITAMTFGACAMAQDSRVATLQHGANFRTYYGADAFISAHEDASDGDVITLTAGEFNLCNISKAITVRGEGMHKTKLSVSYASSGGFKIPTGSNYSLCLEGVTIYYRQDTGYISLPISGSGGSATVIISKCDLTAENHGINVSKCSAVIINSRMATVNGEGNSSITCINSIMPSLSGSTFDVQNCVITDQPQVTNSIIKNSIVYGVSTLNDTNTTSHCLVKEGSSGFADSWYIPTEAASNPDPWSEAPETPVIWNDLFGEDYHLTEAAAQTYLGTDGTQVGLYGGAYPYDITPDYPLVKNLEVKGIHEDGKLKVKINVE